MTADDPQRLFHIARRADWQAAQQGGLYRADSLDAQGFIHLSLARQWPIVLRSWFAGQRDLLLLEIDASELAHEVRFEAADGDRYPHLYGPLEVAAVLSARALDAPEARDADDAGSAD